jgi:hypothetical protein
MVLYWEGRDEDDYLIPSLMPERGPEHVQANRKEREALSREGSIGPGNAHIW